MAALGRDVIEWVAAALVVVMAPLIDAIGRMFAMDDSSVENVGRRMTVQTSMARFDDLPR